MQLCTPSDN